MKKLTALLTAFTLLSWHAMKAADGGTTLRGGVPAKLTVKFEGEVFECYVFRLPPSAGFHPQWPGLLFIEKVGSTLPEPLTMFTVGKILKLRQFYLEPRHDDERFWMGDPRDAYHVTALTTSPYRPEVARPHLWSKAVAEEKSTQQQIFKIPQKRIAHGCCRRLHNRFLSPLEIIKTTDSQWNRIVGRW